MAQFDISSADSQGTIVTPIKPDDFDFDAYAQYEAKLLEKNQIFWQSDSAIAVHRRFRVPTVFTYDCADMELSLGLQLAALNQSMDFTMDIPNFLEPWYGIGTIASAFGVDYQWHQKQAPAVKQAFQSVSDVLSQDIIPVSKTAIGNRTLEMIEFFMEKTKGKMPMSLTDTQSPMNIASHIIDSGNFYMSFFDDPEGLKKLLNIIAELIVDFNKKQLQLIGDCLVSPGHGFASSRKFTGLGMSDDVMVMLSPQQYSEFCYEPMRKAGHPLNGPVFHSCGNWSGKADTVKKIPDLIAVDGAFTEQTDPDINNAEIISDVFNNTGIVVNARMVGETDTVVEKVRKLWNQKMKLIVVTYCKTKKEQQQCYDRIHEITG